MKHSNSSEMLLKHSKTKYGLSFKFTFKLKASGSKCAFAWYQENSGPKTELCIALEEAALTSSWSWGWCELFQRYNCQLWVFWETVIIIKTSLNVKLVCLTCLNMTWHMLWV